MIPARRAFVARACAGLGHSLVAVLLSIGGGTGCSRSGASASLSDAGARSRTAARIVSLSPAMTEALFAIGAGPQVVGRSRFCDYPPEVRALPAVGGFMDADFEAIVDLAPDLVVGAPGPSSSALAAKLAPRGVDAWFPGIVDMSTIQATLRGLGERTGHGEQAARVADAIEERIHKVEASVAGQPAPRVLMVAGLSPIVAAGPKSFIDDLLSRARAINVVRDGAPWQTEELEHVLELDPDVILDGADEGHIGPAAPGWTELRAVRTGHVIPISDPRILRPGPRVAEGLALLAHELHPSVERVTF